ncbi:MAG: hypothetical protein ACYC0V_21460 [Armatimonadota bacterium]
MKLNNQSTKTEDGYAPPRWLWITSIAAILLGIIGTVVGFLIAPADTWLWLVIGFVSFAGLAHGMLAWAAAFRVAQTRWTAAVNRLGHSAIFFLPFLGVILIILLAGFRSYAPWTAHPVEGKTEWFNVPFMISREVILVGALWVLFILLVRRTLQADERKSQRNLTSRNEQHKLTAMSVACVMMYTITGTVIAYDFVMAFDPKWVSTMFSMYYWITGMYAGMAALILMAALMRKSLHVERFLETQQFHDMGNLLLAFSLFSMGLFFGQYLTIWYENLPDESQFIIIRYNKGVWAWLGWTAFITGYVIPFILLQSRRLKRNPRMIIPVAFMVLAGVHLERYVLIAPSLSPTSIMLNPISKLSILMFIGALLLGIMMFFRRYPPISSADEELGRLQADSGGDT